MVAASRGGLGCDVPLRAQPLDAAATTPPPHLGSGFAGGGVGLEVLEGASAILECDRIEDLEWGARACLEFASGAVNDGAQLRQGTCTGGDNQQLAHLRMFNAQRVMVARHSGRCLDIPNASGAAGEVVQQFGCHGAQNQQIVHQGVNSNADFNLRFVHSGLCIWLDGTTAGALARQNACSTTDALNLFAF